jgi:hypothetical protein
VQQSVGRWDGRPFSFTAISIYRIADGRIVEAWYAEDTLGLLEQLGALPAGSGSARQFWEQPPGR